MRTSLSAQLALLELGHLSIDERQEADAAEPPAEEAVMQTLAAVWSDLFALFEGTALEADCEEIGWAFVNLFHRAAQKRSAQLDRATDEIRLLLATADGSEIHSHNLEREVARARSAEAAMIGLESVREVAAMLYMRETGSSWRPAGGSRLNHSREMTSALVEGREFMRARAESSRRSAMPEGARVIFAGGRQSFPDAEQAKAFAANVWDALDQVHGRLAQMVLVHGGDAKGADRLAASWAERRRVPQVVFGLDRRLGARAGFKRNEQMLALAPAYLVAFPGSGVLERLVIQARERRIAILDRRGPLGTNPKRAASLLAR